MSKEMADERSAGPCVYRDPETSDAGFDPSGFELERAWVVRHDRS